MQPPVHPPPRLLWGNGHVRSAPASVTNPTTTRASTAAVLVLTPPSARSRRRSGLGSILRPARGLQGMLLALVLAAALVARMALEIRPST
eukprot:9245649-Pyramimonas_sp.AAC.1